MTISLEYYLMPLLVIPILHLAIFIHELGHAVLARSVGLTVSAFGIGLGRPLLCFRFRDTIVYFCRHHPLMGLTLVHYPGLLVDRWRLLAMFAGGILAQLALCMLALAWYFVVPFGGSIALLVAGINLLTGLPNALPFGWRAGKAQFDSDGMLILRLLFTGRSRLLPLPDRLASMKALTAFAREIGDDRTRQLYLAATAAAWLDLGDCQHAACLLDEAETSTTGTLVYRAYLRWIRGAIHLRKKEFDECLRVWEQAEQMFPEQNRAHARFLLNLGRGEYAVSVGDLPSASRFVDELLSQSDIIKALHAEWTVLHLQHQATAPSKASAEYVRTRWEQLRRSDNSHLGDVQFYRATARLHAALGDLATAADDYRRAVAAVVRLAAALDREDRERYQACQSPLLWEARACFEQLGNLEAVTEIDCLWQNDEMAEEKAGWESVAQRVGIVLLLVYALIGTSLFAVHFALRDIVGMDPTNNRPRVFLQMLLLFGGLFLGYGIITIAISLLLMRKTPRRRAGWFILLLGLLPPLVAIPCAAFIWLRPF